MVKEEWFPLVNEEGETIGKATRRECHSGCKWLHPVVHLHIFNAAGDLYLQKRSMTKDIQPGKWDVMWIMERRLKMLYAERCAKN